MSNNLHNSLSITNHMNITDVCNPQSLQQYEKMIATRSSYIFPIQNISFYLITSMVYDFARKLPYSMDILQDEFVPMDFFNLEPSDVDDNNWFKWDDRRTFFKSMINWGDTFRSGVFLQICNTFQKMLLGEFPNNYYLDEDAFTQLHIDTMTSSDEYNQKFFQILKLMPEYYRRVENTKNNEDRRKMLEEVYSEMMSSIAARAGGIRVTGPNGKIIRDEQPNIILTPDWDVKLMAHTGHGLRYTSDGIPEIVAQIKAKKMKNYPVKTLTKQTSIEITSDEINSDSDIVFPTN